MLSRVRHIVLVCIATLVLHGCRAYSKKIITVEAASKSREKVLLVRNSGQQYKLKRIECHDSICYGYYRLRGRMAKVLVDNNDIKSLHPESTSAEIFAASGVMILSAIIAMIIVVALCGM